MGTSPPEIELLAECPCLIENSLGGQTRVLPVQYFEAKMVCTEPFPKDGV